MIVIFCNHFFKVLLAILVVALCPRWKDSSCVRASQNIWFLHDDLPIGRKHFGVLWFYWGYMETFFTWWIILKSQSCLQRCLERLLMETWQEQGCWRDSQTHANGYTYIICLHSGAHKYKCQLYPGMCIQMRIHAHLGNDKAIRLQHVHDGALHSAPVPDLDEGCGSNQRREKNATP